MPLRRRFWATSGPPGPGTMPSSTLTTRTSWAWARKGIASAIVRAVSVLPFQAIAMLWPRAWGGRGGAIRIGRPLSNSAFSSALIEGAAAPATGRPTTVMSNTRPRLPRTSLPGATSSCQSAAGSAPASAPAPSATPCSRMKPSKASRRRRLRSRSARSRSSTISVAGMNAPSGATGTRRGMPGRTWRPERCAPKRLAASSAVVRTNSRPGCSSR